VNLVAPACISSGINVRQQGTCSQRLGDAAGAAANFQESIVHLERSPVMSAEVSSHCNRILQRRSRVGMQGCRVPGHQQGALLLLC
jgi:hypothetical protein